ncbi:calcium-activated potassium channel subunit alpha-1 isoform B [Alligator mississippiensis]|uniref:Potassium channel subfamily U member 1 n=1 Tax=Alligator mississippiensis TaxID=8496 RepID=A0A151NBJ6_ALLMI|nr:calcium-activated potassium channel subunit alpha-1 isoform B [Alligator mississippiensis]
MMLSAQTFVGRVLVILVFLMSIGSLIIYIINCASPIEYFSSFPDETLPVDMGFNTFFLFYFGLRFLAADDKLKFWLELNSIVDFFTIPPVCASYYLKRNWLGFRFLRALRLLELPKILQFLKITKTSNSIKLVKLLAVFLSTWLTSAGFIHLVENSGDPWINYDNSQFLSYFECLYLIMATMSTVGYGDVVAKTCLGRVSMIFFIIGGLVLFANFIPEIADIVESNKKYEGSYTVVKGRKYIVVCGNITLESVTAFLRDFLPQDTGDICTEILFLGESLPSLELEAVFNCYSPYTTFFHGSALNDEDLKRVQMGSANACLILADICSSEPYTEDTSNIMRVLSIKNHYPNTRVIIQIIQSHNKVYLPNIPNWDWRIGDSIICFAELKLGFIAQSCLVPGLSTLLTSLFVRKESAEVKRKSMRHRNVLKGSAYQVMTYKLSNDFVGMSFPEVCRLCFVKLNLVLFAVEFRFGIHGNSILINPSAKIMLHRNVMGFFIAKSMAEVKRAHFYCKACHSDIDNPKLIEKCHCRSKLRRRTITEKLKARRETLCVPDQDPVKSRSLGVLPPSSYAASASDVMGDKNSDAMLDSTGMFHWCHAVSLEKAILNPKKEATSDLHDHIVVCVFGDANTTLIGLRDFVMPLRASNFIYEELRDIVFVGSLEYLKREWGFIQNFPKLWLYQGSALSCADLKAVNIRHCAMCAILSYSSKSSSSPILVDTESILATLNIRAMQFKCSTVSEEAVGRVRTLENQSALYYKRIPIITELKSMSNAHFIDQSAGSSGSQIPEQELHLSTPFSSGAIFSDNFLDSLLSTTYCNHHVLALLQTLVTGGTSPELEEQLAEKNELSASDNSISYVAPRVRCKLALLPLWKELAAVSPVCDCSASEQFQDVAYRSALLWTSQGMVRASGTSYGDEPLHSRYEEPSSDMTRQLFAPLNALGLQSYMAAGAALLNTHKLFHPKHMSGLRAARDFSLPRPRKPAARLLWKLSWEVIVWDQQKTALGVQGGEEEETQPAWCCQDAKVTAWSRCSFHQ